MKLSASDRIAIETAERCDRRVLEFYKPHPFPKCFCGYADEESENPPKPGLMSTRGCEERMQDFILGPYRSFFDGMPTDGYSRG